MGHYRDMLFSDYIKEWLNSIQNQVAKSTYKGYYDHVNGRMIPYFENEELLLKDVTLADIYNYIEYLFSEGLKPNTVKHHRSILSCIFTRAVEQELFEYNFINNLKPIKSDKYIGNFYKHDELLHLILTKYNENEIYEMKENALNNIYEDIDKTNQFQGMKKVVSTLQV